MVSLAPGGTDTVNSIDQRAGGDEGTSIEDVLDVLSQQIAILDEDSRILRVNEAWRRFGRENGSQASQSPEGISYLELCESATEPWSVEASAVAKAIREIMAGTRDRFQCDYPSHCPDEPRWFEVYIAPFASEGRLRIAVVYDDITDRKQAEETLRLDEARLNSLLLLFQKSSELDEKEIIQMALEEAVELTFSTIGYCHLVHEDQQAIELVTWSRDTLKICKAVTEKHYPIAVAGVWADCARIQAPVVHNDFKNLPERKGLPDGHAEVTRHLSVPVVEDGRVSLIMGVGNKAIDYDDSDVRQLQLLANDAWLVVWRRRVESRLQVMVMTDSLTGLNNRRYFFDRGRKEIKRVQRYGGHLSVLLLDIDAFKAINDTFGHDAGDSVLVDLADTMRCSLRDVDIVARIGGEEFAVLLPSTVCEDARPLAERIVAEVRQMRFEALGKAFGITVSIGLASYEDGIESIGELLKAADVALYQAKAAGRDCVVG